MLTNHTERLDELIFNLISEYAKENDLQISQDSIYEDGKITIVIQDPLADIVD